MDRRSWSIILLIALLVSSCAQVGTISGGERDSRSPAVVRDGMSPPNGTTNFREKTIEITFDEFIKINSPRETISLVPADAKIDATARKKTLHLEIEGELKPETTYAIYLNGTVQDITEGNDSLIQYVFSTGSYIDTLKYSGWITDAFTYQPVKDIFVALYPDEDSSLFRKPLYFARTASNGWFTLSYVKPGKYKMLAFDDANRNMTWQKTERVAFREELLQLDSSRTDSIPMRLSSPLPKPKIRNVSFHGPSQLQIGSNRSLENARYFIDGEEVTTTPYFYKPDSVALLFDPLQRTGIQLVVQTPEYTDTVKNVKLPEKEQNRQATYETNLKNGNLLPGQMLEIRFTDFITETDTSLFELIASDSVELNKSVEKIAENRIQVSFDPGEFKELKLNILPKAVKFKNSIDINSSTIKINSKIARDFGSVALRTDSLPEHAIIEVLQGNVVVRSILQKDIGSQSYLIETLEPGNYTFRAIIDENSNGKWDTGNFEEQRRPEEIWFFPESVRVRANWEMEVTLIPEN